jgi:hypothetical protein
MQGSFSRANFGQRWPIIDLIGQVADWWREREMGRARQAEFDSCDSYDRARIAGDMGLPVNELHQLSSYRADSAEALTSRMAALHIQPKAVDGWVMRDLERLCTTCTCKSRCKKDLLREPNDPVWKDYCPNVGTLQSLLEGSTGRH